MDQKVKQLGLAMSVALLLGACASKGRQDAAAEPTPVPSALVGFEEAAAVLGQARRTYDASALGTAARSLSACASTGAQARDCAALGSQAAWLLSLVQESEGRKDEAYRSASLSVDLAEAAVKGLSPTAESRALLADAYMRQAWLGDLGQAFTRSIKVLQTLEKVLSPTAQSLQVQAVLARSRYYQPGLLGGDAAKATAAFAGLVEQEPGQDLHQAYLGLSQLKLGQKQKAKASFEKALALNPSNPVAKQALKKNWP